jgi:hypothetical protein
MTASYDHNIPEAASVAPTENLIVEKTENNSALTGRSLQILHIFDLKPNC